MLTRDSAPFANDGCGAFSGSPTTLGGAPAQSLGAGCYEYVLTGTDAVGNTTSIRTVVQVHGAATQIAVAGATANLTSGTTRRADRDAPRRRREHRSLGQLNGDRIHEAVGCGHRVRHRQRDRSNGVATKTITGQLAGAVTMEATAAGFTTGTYGAFSVVQARRARSS